ncbi:O-antigen ligase family protein [Paenochrobactrum sp. BZR 588]|uniref:O-antigen ligase family protein n=1 Tax=unclassified Paenochrobactrum TaxID=2639760 RepID=UPI003853FACF
MNNTAIRKRTEPLTAPATQYSRRNIAIAVSTIIFSILLISFRPFSGRLEAQEGGDIVNQLGFSALGVFSVLSLFTLAKPHFLRQLLNPFWLLMCGFLIISAFAAPDLPSALRAVIFTLIGMICMFSIIGLLQDADGFSKSITIVSSLVLVVSYIGVIILPDLATHGYDVVEPQNSYLWRGVFTHKNIAGPVMAAFAFAGIYLMRRKMVLRGLIIMIASTFFVAQTGSKTTTALVPLTVLVVIFPGLFNWRWMTVLTTLIINIVFSTLTIGTVIFDPLRKFVESLSIDATFTGRTSIWSFALDKLHQHPWAGFGFESFWNSPVSKQAANPYYLDWDVRSIVHGHNGYLDIAMTMGIPALICLITVIIILPLRDFSRCLKIRENILLADFFVMIMFFCTLNAHLESFFFRRIDPAWLILMLSAFGLRLCARIEIPTHDR